MPAGRQSSGARILTNNRVYSMVAMIGSIQRFFLPLLLIGLCTGLLALIPKVGWLLGIAVFFLASQYAGRRSMALDLMVTIAFWVAIREIAVLLHIY